MGLNKKSYFSTKNLAFLVVLLLIFGCASIQKPAGGPKDRTPPKLLKATPPNMTRNFKEKQIRLDFDEYFNLKNPFQEIIISPTQEKPPTFKVSKKSIVVDFKDTLEKNTTYVINFGKAIADVNENNVLENFTYVFSTGPHIDSLSISGDVKNSLTGEKVKDATVMLFPVKQDTLFGKKKPSIFATTDTSGNFSLNNLHAEDYHIYALKEDNPNKVYDNEKELVGFLKASIHLNKDTSNIHLSLFRQDPEKLRVVDRRFDLDGKLFFTFNKPVENPSVKVVDPAALNSQKIVDINPTRDTIGVYMRSMDFDSIKVAMIQNNKPFDTVTLRKARKESYERIIKLQYNISPDRKLQPNTDLVVTSSIPLQNFDQSLIALSEDSVRISNFKITRDTANTHKLFIRYPWKQNSQYQLVFNDDALTDIYGDKSKKLATLFQPDKTENYGQLAVKVSIPDTSKAYVVELLNSEKKVVHSDPVTNKTTLNYKNYRIGKYYIRVVYDTNKNGKWDSGNVKQRQYPENIWQYSKEIVLRSNWDAEETLDIPKEPIVP